MKPLRFAIPVLVIVACAFMLVRYYVGRRPSRYLVPFGYVGLVKIQYGVAGAPSFPMEDGRTLIRIPSSGFVQTRDAFAYGLGDPEDYYYVNGAIRQRLHTDSDPYT